MRSILGLLIVVFALAACGGAPAAAPTVAPAAPAATEAPAASGKPVTMAWYPNESAAELKDARTAFIDALSQALGRPVVEQTTTDYIIAIEALANNNADLGFFGAEGYVQAHAKNPNIVPVAIPSGADGTEKTAVYYSWLAVQKGQESNYQDGGSFKIDNIQGKRFSFVSNSSTSGFRVPTNNIITYFSTQDAWKSLTTDDLIEGGANNFFSEVQFGGSHQGSAVNLLAGKVDVAAFCDTCVANYVKLVSGTENTPGAVYQVIEGAAEPFDKYVGAQFVIISATPVINAPFVANSSTLTAEEIKKLQDYLTSDAVSNDPKIWATKAETDAGYVSLFRKTKAEKFIVVPDSFFDPIRAMSK